MADNTPAGAVPRLAWLPVGAAVLTSTAVLAATASRYGYHRDELYFLMLKPAWGYVDQPPLTPMVAQAAAALFGDTVWGIRVPAMLCVAAAIVLAALTTRELGGGRGAQALSAFGFAFATVTLLTGHLMVTATVDFVLWAAILLCVVKAQLRAAPRWWLVAGAIVGVSMYNKLLIAMLLIGIAVGLLTLGPRSVLRSRWLWAGVGLALVIGSPNLIYQATHGFPQLAMAGALTENNGADVRAQLLPFQLLLVGPPVAPIWIAGFVALLRRPAWRPIRFLAGAYVTVIVLNFTFGGQIYYAFGLLALLLAAGCVPAAEWAARGRVRRSLLVAALALNAAVNVVLSLPVLPVDVVGRTVVTAINPVVGDQVGWPVYVRTVANVYNGLSPDDKGRAVIVTGNYGEAGSVRRYGSEYGLPPVYSGQNELFFQGPPPSSATVVIVWTQDFAATSRRYDACERRAVMDNGVGVDNEEQGSVVAVCRLPAGGWTVLWPHLQHYD